MNRNKKGFTLVELLAVIVIFGVLITIAVLAIKPRTRQARKNILVNDAKSYIKAAKEAYTLDEVEGETVCHDISYLNQAYVEKNDDSYSGTVVSEFNGNEVKQIISITNGRYYIFASGNITVDDVTEEMPVGFISSCSGSQEGGSSGGGSEGGSSYNVQDLDRSTLAYKLFMNEGKATLTENLALINQRTSTVSFNDLENDTTKSGIYKATDDLGTTYYYRGVINNNWVSFGGFYWRILRINGDGSIRLIYSGLANSDHTGANAAIKNKSNGATIRYSQYKSFARNITDVSGLTNTNINASYTNGRFGLAYVGYMYNPAKVLGTYHSELPSNSKRVNNYSTFTSITNIKNDVPFEYYFFKNFNLSTDCFTGNDTDDSGTCTLVCRELGVDCILSNWNTLATTEGNYSTTAAGIYPATNPTQYIYTSPYKYTCWGNGTAVTKVNSDGTTSVYVSCPLVSEIVGTIKNQATQAKTRLHGLFAPSFDAATQNIYDSNMKVELEYWYEHNIASNTDSNGNYLEAYVSDGIFCNDRTTNNAYPIHTNGATQFMTSYVRNASNSTKTPSYLCPNMERDAFTLKTNNQASIVTPINVGNKLLNYPIGLITMDEAIFAGGKYNTANNDYFLRIGVNTWTMTPYAFFVSNYNANNWFLKDTGSLNGAAPSSAYYARPVINLKSDVIYVSGTGTEANPYTISI